MRLLCLVTIGHGTMELLSVGTHLVRTLFIEACVGGVSLADVAPAALGVIRNDSVLVKRVSVGLGQY